MTLKNTDLQKPYLQKSWKLKLLGWQGTGPDVQAGLYRSFKVAQATPLDSLIDTSAAALVLYLSCYEYVPSALFFGWIFAMLFGSVAQEALMIWSRKNEIANRNPTKGGVLFVILFSLYGGIAGLGPVLFFPHIPPLGQAVMSVMLGLWVFMDTFASIPGVSYGRLITTVSLTLVAFWINTDTVVFSIALIFCVWMFKRMDMMLMYHNLLREQLELKGDLLSAVTAKDRLLGTVSHELRTPLQGILGMARLLRSHPNDQRDHRLSLIERSGSTLLKIINDLLDFARDRHATLSQPQQTFDPKDLVESIIHTIGAEHTDRISLDVDASLPTTLSSDSYAIGRITTNVLSNALKYAPTGSIEVRLSFAHDVLSLAVEDYGPGISAKDQKNIFKDFVRLDQNDKSIHGTGLGLYICQQLARDLGGDISVVSDGIKGSTFHIAIPVNGDMATKMPRRTPSNLEIIRPPTQFKSFLLIEDNLINIEVATAFLRTMDCSVETATTGKAGLVLWENKSFDAVLLDIGLPDMSGVDVVKRIRAGADEKKSQITVIGITAHLFPEDYENYLREGFDSILPKPFLPNDLATVLAGEAVKQTTRDDVLIDTFFLQSEIDMLGVACFEKLLLQFSEAFDPAISDLIKMIDEKSWSRVAKQAHWMAGMCSNFGMVQLAEFCRQIIEDAVDGALHNSQDVEAQLRNSFAQSCEGVEKTLAERA